MSDIFAEVKKKTREKAIVQTLTEQILYKHAYKNVQIVMILTTLAVLKTTKNVNTKGLINLNVPSTFV